MIIKGSMHSKNDVFLDGAIEGDLDVENCRLLIGPHGKVVANVRAREVDIHGIMTGNVESTERTSISGIGTTDGRCQDGWHRYRERRMVQGQGRNSNRTSAAPGNVTQALGPLCASPLMVSTKSNLL